MSTRLDRSKAPSQVSLKRQALETSFGQYQILSPLGAGGMGEVFLARVKREGSFEKMVALKRMLPHLSADPTFVEMFRQEAAIAARLNHPNVVHIFDFGTLDSYPFIVMEYVEGLDLRRVIDALREQGGSMPLSIALRIAMDCCQGLDSAHRLTHPDGTPLGLIHRDISPRNILLSWQGAVKITDFGLAKTGAHLSAPGEGKEAYMSPEQAQGRPVDARSDLYSLAVVLHELITGSTPHSLTLPSSLRPDIPAGLDHALLNALAPLPQERYANAAAMAKALQVMAPASAFELASFLSSLGQQPAGGAVEETTQVSKEPIVAPAEPDPAPQRTVRPQAMRSRKLWMIVALLALAVTAALAAGRAILRTLPGEMDIRSDPPGASILVEGRDTGQKTPVRLSQGPGPARVEIRLRGRVPWAGVVTVRAGTTSSINVQLPEAKGSLKVDTMPQGSRVRIDGQAVAGVTPLIIKGLATGVHQLEVTRKGYQPSRSSAEVRPGGETVTLMTLRSAKGEVTVKTDPPGAAVRVDGKPTEGVTPLTIGGLDPGERRIEVLLEGFQPALSVAEVKPGSETVALLSLKPDVGWAMVRSSPSGAGVMVDGQATGQATPARIEMLPGQHEITFALAGYAKAVAKVTVRSDQEEQVSQTLLPLPAVLVVKAQPAARLLLDGTVLSAQGRDVKDGSHVLVAQGQGFQVTLRIKVRSRLIDWIHIDARPWVDVSYGGRDLGPTPLSSLAIRGSEARLEFMRDGQALRLGLRLQ